VLLVSTSSPEDGRADPASVRWALAGFDTAASTLLRVLAMPAVVLLHNLQLPCIIYKDKTQRENTAVCSHL
jgi:hypothetical protein